MEARDGDKLALTGYVRGGVISADRLVHIPGLGDFQVDRIVTAQEPLTLSTSRKDKDMFEVRRLSPKCRIETLLVTQTIDSEIIFTATNNLYLDLTMPDNVHLFSKCMCSARRGDRRAPGAGLRERPGRHGG